MIKLQSMKSNIFATGAFVLCILPSQESLADGVIDATYSCQFHYMSVDYKSGSSKFKEEYKGSELDLALSEVGESKEFTLSVRNGKAYFPNSNGDSQKALPLDRKGNKLFFDTPLIKSPTNEGDLFVKIKGFLNLKTNQFLQTSHTYSQDKSIDIKFTVNGICW